MINNLIKISQGPLKYPYDNFMDYNDKKVKVQNTGNYHSSFTLAVVQKRGGSGYYSNQDKAHAWR